MSPENKTSEREPSLHMRLSWYGIAAAMATVALNADDAEAVINLYDNGGLGWILAPSLPPPGQLFLFDELGNTAMGPATAPPPGFDFGIFNFKSAGSQSRGVQAVSGATVGVINAYLPSGVLVGPTTWPASSPAGPNAIFASGNKAQNGWAFPPAASSRGYVGLKFDAGGVPVYGWADISINAPAGPATTVTLHRYIVQDDGSPVQTGSISPVPEPHSLALLALGATGLLAYRRKKAKAEKVNASDAE